MTHRNIMDTPTKEESNSTVSSPTTTCYTSYQNIHVETPTSRDLERIVLDNKTAGSSTDQVDSYHSDNDIVNRNQIMMILLSLSIIATTFVYGTTIATGNVNQNLDSNLVSLLQTHVLGSSQASLLRSTNYRKRTVAIDDDYINDDDRTLHSKTKKHKDHRLRLPLRRDINTVDDDMYNDDDYKGHITKKSYKKVHYQKTALVAHDDANLYDDDTPLVDIDTHRDSDTKIKTKHDKGYLHDDDTPLIDIDTDRDTDTKIKSKHGKMSKHKKYHSTKKAKNNSNHPTSNYTTGSSSRRHNITDIRQQDDVTSNDGSVSSVVDDDYEDAILSNTTMTPVVAPAMMLPSVAPIQTSEPTVSVAQEQVATTSSTIPATNSTIAANSISSSAPLPTIDVMLPKTKIPSPHPTVAPVLVPVSDAASVVAKNTVDDATTKTTTKATTTSTMASTSPPTIDTSIGSTNVV